MFFLKHIFETITNLIFINATMFDYMFYIQCSQQSPNTRAKSRRNIYTYAYIAFSLTISSSHSYIYLSNLFFGDFVCSFQRSMAA